MLILRTGILYLSHRCENPLPGLVGRKQPEALRSRKLQIHTDAVCKETDPLHQIRQRTGNHLYMNIAFKMMSGTKLRQCLIQKLHRILRSPKYAGAQKKPLDIISPVELHRQRADLIRGKGRTLHVIRNAVHAIVTVKYTVVRHENLQKRNASAIRRKGMTDPGCNAIAHALSAAATIGPA